jgi:hypothetical protein
LFEHKKKTTMPRDEYYRTELLRAIRHNNVDDAKDIVDTWIQKSNKPTLPFLCMPRSPRTSALKGLDSAIMAACALDDTTLLRYNTAELNVHFQGLNVHSF